MEAEPHSLGLEMQSSDTTRPGAGFFVSGDDWHNRGIQETKAGKKAGMNRMQEHQVALSASIFNH